MPVRLRRALDFLVVADHAMYLGWIDGIRRQDELLLENETAKRWAELYAAGDTKTANDEIVKSLVSTASKKSHPRWERSVWRRQVEAADQYNDPGNFTALIGYEWTSMPSGDNLHRVVIYRDGAEKAGEFPPFSSLDSKDPEDLWRFLATYEQKTGGSVLAIPHNSNVSGGTMFPDRQANGKSLSADYIEQRAKWEPLVEATQYKGDSETHPFLSPNDEFADYETWDRGNIAHTKLHENWMFKHEYARSALKLGLSIAAQSGVNPYQFGMIGSTDSHTSLATADEDNFFGKYSKDEPAENRWRATWFNNDSTSIHGDRVEFCLGNSRIGLRGSLVDGEYPRGDLRCPSAA